VEFIRWQVLRAGIPLRLMAQNQGAGPIPLAAAHAATGLHMPRGVIAAGQHAVATGDVDTLAAEAGQLRAAREALKNAIGNTDLLLNMLKSAAVDDAGPYRRRRPSLVRSGYQADNRQFAVGLLLVARETGRGGGDLPPCPVSLGPVELLGGHGYLAAVYFHLDLVRMRGDVVVPRRIPRRPGS
jgi:hypothetical protein